MSRKIILAAAAILALAAGAAQAQENSLTISTKGLDLSVARDAKVFYSRLSQAAADLCGGAPSYFMGSQADHFEGCYRQVMKAAVAQTDAPLVTARYEKAAPKAQRAAR